MLYDDVLFKMYDWDQRTREWILRVAKNTLEYDDILLCIVTVNTCWPGEHALRLFYRLKKRDLTSTTGLDPGFWYP